MADDEEIKTFFNIGEAHLRLKNPYLISGPQGMLLHKDVSPMEVRVMLFLPGVPQTCLHVDLDNTRRWILFKGKEHYRPNHATLKYYTELRNRSYEGAIGFNGSRCCFIISRFSSKLDDGALIMSIKKQFVTAKPCPSCSVVALGRKVKRQDCEEVKKLWTDKNGEIYVDLHPYVTEGPPSSLHTEVLKNGAIIGRADVAGLSRKRLKVRMEEGRLRFCGRFGGQMGDADWWEYAGSVGMDDLDGKPTWEVENGVLWFRIVPSFESLMKLKDFLSESLKKTMETVERLKEKSREAGEKLLERERESKEDSEAELMENEEA